MMSEKNSANLVSQRVQKTKKEIEELKAELEKLINVGIKQNSNENETVKKFPTESTTNMMLPVPETNRTNTNRSRSVSRLTDVKEKTSVMQEINAKSSSKKVRNYDPEEAREYIKKQKEKRLIERKLKKADVNTKIDTKQRLKDLHKKSLELVNKNVRQKRERSQSREKQQNENVVPPSKIPNIVNVRAKELVRNNVNFSRGTKLTTNNNNVEQEDNKEKAAIKIQAAYRGYKERKLYKSILASNIMTKRDLNGKDKEIQTNNNTVPEWLQISSTPLNPYNFINTVKRKLNLAVKEYTNVAVQSSILQEDQSKLILKTKDQIKELLERSIKEHKSNESFVSHLKLKEPSVHLINNEETTSDSDTSKNIPDISSESTFSKDTLSTRLNLNKHTNDSIISSNKCSYNTLSKSKKTDFLTSVINTTRGEYLIEFLDYMKDYEKTPQRNQTNTNTEEESLQEKSISSFNEEVVSTYKDEPFSLSNRESTSLVKKESLNLLKEDLISSIKEKSVSSIVQDTISSRNKDLISSIKNDSISLIKTNSVKEIQEDYLSSFNEEAFSTTSNVDENSSGSKSEILTTVPSLVRPSITLSTSHDLKPNTLQTNKVLLKDGVKTTMESVVNKLPFLLNVSLHPKINLQTNNNQIHLKFEAELHLLNDFNESLRQFMAVDKVLQIKVTFSIN